MIKVTFTLLFILASSFAYAECWTHIDALLREKGSFSGYSRRVDYKGGSLLFTPALDSNKLAISSLVSGKVLYVAKDAKKVVGVVSPSAGQFVLLIEVKNRVLLAKNLIEGNVTRVSVDSDGSSLEEVGLSRSHLGSVKNLYISYLMRDRAIQRYSAPEHDSVQKDSRWYDREGMPLRTGILEDSRTNNVLRQSSQLDSSDIPAR